MASLLCPARLRPAIRAIYAFARTADDLADEGEATAAVRLADLAAYRADLAAVTERRAPSPRWTSVFGPLAEVIDAFALPPQLLNDLLDAFAQDVTQHTYRDRAELLDYCRRSANPVGRLLLHLYGVDNAESLQRSDAICTALQLINFWQDVAVDTSRGRLYLPMVDLQRHGVDPAALLAGVDGPAVRAAIADAVSWARGLMLYGAPLVHAVSGRAGLELRLVVQGGWRIAERIEQSGHATLLSRPTIGPLDAPLMLWRAARMPKGPLRGTAASPHSAT